MDSEEKLLQLSAYEQVFKHGWCIKHIITVCLAMEHVRKVLGSHSFHLVIQNLEAYIQPNHYFLESAVFLFDWKPFLPTWGTCFWTLSPLFLHHYKIMMWPFFFFADRRDIELCVTLCFCFMCVDQVIKSHLIFTNFTLRDLEKDLR